MLFDCARVGLSNHVKPTSPTQTLPWGVGFIGCRVAHAPKISYRDAQI